MSINVKHVYCSKCCTSVYLFGAVFCKIDVTIEMSCRMHFMYGKIYFTYFNDRGISFLSEIKLKYVAYTFMLEGFSDKFTVIK